MSWFAVAHVTVVAALLWKERPEEWMSKERSY